MMASIQQAQAASFEALLARVLDSRSPHCSPAQECAPAMPSVQPTPGNFASCKARFSGAPTESLDGFIDAIESFKDCANVSEANALRGLSMLLTHDAATWWQGVKTTIVTWDGALRCLRCAFGDSRPPHRIYIELFSNPQSANEKTELYVAKARAQLSRLPSGDISEKAKLDMIYGLLHYKIRKRLRREEFVDFDDLLYKIRSIEETTAGSHTTRFGASKDAAAAVIRSPKKSPPPPPPTTAPLTSRAASADQSSTPGAAPRRLRPSVDSSTTPVNIKRQYCVYCKNHGHTRNQCRKLLHSVNKINVVNKNNVSCYGCGESGVIRANCSKCNQNFSAIDFTPVSKSVRSTTSGISYATKTSAHVSSFKDFSVACTGAVPNLCSQNRSIKSKSSICANKNTTLITKEPRYIFTNASTPRAINCLPKRNNNSLVSRNKQSRHYKSISDVYSNIKRDTSRPVIKGEYYKQFKSVSSREPSQCALNVSPYAKHGFSKLNRKHSNNNSQCPSRSRVYPEFSGQIRENRIPSRVTMTFSGQDQDTNNVTLLNLKSDNERSVTFSSISSHNVDTPRRPVLNIEVLGIRGRGIIDTAAKGTIAGYSLFALLKKRNHAFKPSCMRVKLADGSAPTRRMLSTTLEVKIEGKVVEVDFYVFPDATDNETLLGIDFIKAAGIEINFANSTWRFHGSKTIFQLEYEYPRNISSYSAADFLREDEGTMLSSSERESLAALLQSNEDIFRSGGDPTPYAEHHIDTGEHPPISVPPYRLTPAKKQLMKAELDKMLKDGVIEECESAWTSPAVLVPKKDNSVRFCVDYRRLNAITKTDSYPLPLMDELLQLTKRHCFMSSIDLKAGYWQVQVRPSDRDKTAFVSPFGTYRFTRMPFGLKNAPSTFQRLIDRFRSGASLQGIILLAYLDDLLIISKDFSSHLDDLQKVFDRLRLFGLRANRVKCFFARPTINYLGHVITPEGIKPDPSKIDAVLRMPSPKNLKHLKSFLQTCSWFRKFVPNFSQVAQPLTVLTRKNELWRWDSQQQQAFQCLKDKLTSAPILVQADYTKVFVLRTDASNYALGAVLLQGEGVEERPIEYASRLLTQAERNYTTTEKEALAVVWATDKFRGYLDGHPVVVKSDHQPLKWLLTLKTPSGRLIRWAMKLQAFDIRFEYMPGKCNVVADALSRPQCDNATTESCDVCGVSVDIPRFNAAELRKEQLDDPEIAKIINSLEDTEPIDTQWLNRGYIMNQGVLYRYLPDSDTEQPQLVVPATMRERILKEFHDAPTAGHQGVERTLNRISQNYYFVGMRKYVTDYLRNCEDCQRYKAANHKPAGLLQTPILHQRGEVLAVDLFGPLPEGQHGEKWVLLVEDTASRWVELFALKEATAEICAPILINEYFLRYGFPRRIISDNGVQFVSATMQQCMFILGVKQNLIPLYHPEANPAERKNRDLRTQLSMLVKNEHRRWPEFLSSVRFAMNSATCSTIGSSPAQVMFAREMRTPFDAQHDLRAILDKENFLPQITPYLRRFLSNWDTLRDRAENRQDGRKKYADRARQTVHYQVGDLVFITTHLLSDGSKGRTRKFMPKRDGPYRVSKIVSPTTYEVTDLDSTVLGKFHASDLKLYNCQSGQVSAPVQPRRLRGRPRHGANTEPPTKRCSGSEGEDITRPCFRTHRAVPGGARATSRDMVRAGTANGSARGCSGARPVPESPQSSEDSRFKLTTGSRRMRSPRVLKAPAHLADYHLQ